MLNKTNLLILASAAVAGYFFADSLRSKVTALEKVYTAGAGN